MQEEIARNIACVLARHMQFTSADADEDCMIRANLLAGYPFHLEGERTFPASIYAALAELTIEPPE